MVERTEGTGGARAAPVRGMGGGWTLPALALACAAAALAPAGRALAQERGGPSGAGKAEAGTAEGAAEKAPEAPRRRWRDLPMPPLRQFTVPKPERVVLENGAVLFLMEDHELPTIDLIVLFPGGSVCEPRAKAGLASVCGEVMRTGGAAGRSGDEIDQVLEDMASSVETSFGDWQGRAGLSCMKESFDATLAVLADVLERPEFREEKIALSKKQAKGGIARRNDDPAGIARREYARAIYGDASPFGWTTEVATIDAITRDDLVAFHKSFVGQGKGTIVGVVGDFDSKEMRAKVERLVGRWPAAREGKPGFEPAETAKAQGDGPAPRVLFARKTDVNQATIVLGHMGERRRPDDPDYAPLIVLNDILGGGGFASRLLQRVRTEMGLAYGVGSRWNAPYSHKGTFSLSCQTKSGSTVQAIRAMRRQLELVCSEPVTADELRVAKESIQQQLVFESESKAAVLDRALRYEFFGFPLDYLERFQAAVAKVTAEDCLRVAKKHLAPARLLTVVVGNDKEFDAPLSELGEVAELDVSKPAFPPAGAGGGGATAAEGDVEKGRAVIARALEARGGRAALEKVRSFRVRAKGTQVTQMGPMPVEVEQLVAFPDRIRMEMRLAPMSITYGYDGERAWVKAPQGVMDVPESRAREIRENVEKDEIRILLALGAPDAKPLWVGVEELGGAKLDAIDFGEGARLLFDEKGNLAAKKETGPQGTMLSSWSDFRAVEGVYFPFAVKTEADGQTMLEVKVESVEVNPEAPADAFKKPEGPAMQPGRPSGASGRGGGE
jgi:zinc protease